MTDKRVARTRAAAKDALITLLAQKRLQDVTVSELAAAAGMSRSTFYANFQGIAEVFGALVTDFLAEARPLRSQLRCQKCREASDEGRLPYCIAVRSTERYRDVVREASFLPTLLRIVCDGPDGVSYAEPYLELGVGMDEAKALLTFQMAGCHTAALSNQDDSTWPKTQKAIDTFIAGGMRALKATTPQHEP